MVRQVDVNMSAELKNKVIVAASAAKIAGFENTYEALLDILRALKGTSVEHGTSTSDVPTQSHIH